MKVSEYMELVDDLNGKVFLDVYGDGSNMDDFSSNPFSYGTDGTECNVCFREWSVFFSGNYCWICEDEENFIPYREQVLNHIKKELNQMLVEIKSIISDEEINDFEAEQEANEAFKRATDKLS